MSWAAGTTPAPAGVDTPKARLRWAGLADLDALCAVYRAARPDGGGDAQEMTAWLEHGGAILLESDGAPIAAARWREEGGGWRVDPATDPGGDREQGFERWLMTKVEALAIRANIPTLTVEAPGPEALPSYRRMGYRPLDAADLDAPLVKRVGGTWQVQGDHR